MEGKISIVYARPEAKISLQVIISVVSQYVIGFTCDNESMLIGLFRQRQFADERKWLLVSADVRGAGTRDEPLRTSAWEATPSPPQKKIISCPRQISLPNFSPLRSECLYVCLRLLGASSVPS